MSKEDSFEMEGTVVDTLPNTPCFVWSWKMGTS
jgi:translation initiation factor IF-1